MKNLILIIVMIFTLGVNAQQKEDIKPVFVEQYNTDGSQTDFDINQPTRSVSDEYAVISSNKCVEWLFLADYYTYVQLDQDNRMNVKPYYAIKSALYSKLFKSHNCSKDDYERFKILKLSWYLNSEKELYGDQ